MVNVPWRAASAHHRRSTSTGSTAAPFSPCTGSKTTAATSPPLTSRRTASGSSAGTCTTSTAVPSRPRRYSGLWVSASAPSDLPWKPPSTATTRVRPVARRASLTATSTASAPLSPKYTLGRACWKYSASRAAACAATGLARLRVEVGSVPSCSRTAASTSGCRWPSRVTAYEPKSSAVRPSDSVTRQPSPDTSVAPRPANEPVRASRGERWRRIRSKVSAEAAGAAVPSAVVIRGRVPLRLHGWSAERSTRRRRRAVGVPAPTASGWRSPAGRPPRPG